MKIIIIIVIFSIVGIIAQAQPDNNRNKNGFENGNCPTCNPVPIEFEWILILGGSLLGGYFIIKKKKNEGI